MRILSMALALAFGLAFVSCIEKEPLNAECDIEGASLSGEILLNSDVDDVHDSVTIVVKNYVNVTSLAPEFKLTPGATICPASGTVRNFTDAQEYTVTSQDGLWRKTYKVAVVKNNPIVLKSGFEDVRLITTSQGGKYDEFIDIQIDPDTEDHVSTLVWASGNSGFALTNGNKPPETYPTYQAAYSLPGEPDGKCVAMETRSTGAWGALVGKPLAAGNLFIGKFDPSNAVNNPLQATQFGMTFLDVPRYFSGYYKYTPGEIYQRFNESTNKLEAVPGKKDECNIYAVFFESTEDMKRLDGTNVLSDDNPNIKAVARFSSEQRRGASEWTYFHLPFVFRDGVQIDPEKLANGGYSIAVVMTSSIDGDYFSGAIGSTLFVDEIEVKI